MLKQAIGLIIGITIGYGRSLYFGLVANLDSRWVD